MHRRRFLALLGGAAAAGCSSPEAGVGTDQRTLTPVDVPATETTTPGSGEPILSRGRFGEASIVNLRTGPRTVSLFPVRFGGDGLQVELRFTTTATFTHPARLTATVSNTDPAPTTVSRAALPPFDGVLAADGEGRPAPSGATPPRQLVPVTAFDSEDGPAYERGSAGYWRATASQPSADTTLELDAEESRTLEYVLLGAPDSEGFSVGQYATDGPRGSLSLAVWDTGAPGPRRESRFTDRAVPDLPNTDGTDWFHEATSRTGIFLRPTIERGSSPATFRFTLVDHTIDPLGGNPEEWKLYKLVDGKWYRVAPWTIELAAGPIAPGETFDYVVAAAHGPAPECDCTDTGGVVGRLGGGLYALEAGYSRVRTSETYAALLRFDAPDLRVEPTEGATVERHEDRTVVTRPEWNDGSGEPTATMTVTRARDLLARRVLPEQVYRRPYAALRDVVPYLAETPVVLRTGEELVRDFLGRGVSRRGFSYEGETYVAVEGTGETT
ncbi:hypothetical protein [Halorarius litoreus]|uniref:hypothetical protein n=1 Tax=Halorarius litoreus TaxID=2962676 RepID=UPI0020CB919C|nr:hypothetical protein [Halorarius litoreus]